MSTLDILTTSEVASELRCSKAHVCNAIAGKLSNCTPLPALCLGRRKVVRREVLAKWIEENERAMLSTSPERGRKNA